MTGQHLDLDQLADLLASGYDAAEPPMPADRSDPTEPTDRTDRPDPTDRTEPADRSSGADAAAVVMAAAAAAHASSCPACTAELQSLQHAQELVSATLAGLTDPPLPAGLAARLDDALARERSSAAVVDPAAHPQQSWQSSPVPNLPAAASSPGTVLPLRRRRSRWQPWAAGAAAAAVLGTAGVLLSRTDSGPTATSSTAVAGRTAGHPPADPAVPTSSTGADYRRPAALAAALPALLRGPLTPLSALRGRQSRGPTPAASPNSAAPQLPAATPLDRLREPAALTDCLAALQAPGRPVLPRALDYARYAGQPALIVVLPSARAGKLDVYAVGAGCSAADARVLTFSRLAPP